MSRITLALAALALAASGCSSLGPRAEYKDYRSVGVQPLKNGQGHVVGHKETLRANGDTVARITLYLPRIEGGAVVGYEELVPGGSVLRGLDGRRMGGRFADLRSRGTNPGNRGLTIIVHSKPAPGRMAAPDIDHLRSLARLD